MIRPTFLLLGIALASGCRHVDQSSAVDGGDGSKQGVGKTSAGQRMMVDFSAEAGLSGWEVEDDVVMGGRSDGSLSINEAGHAVFSGEVSLENDGGFSSVQNYFEPIDVSAYTKAVFRVKGDGKVYQFRVGSDPDVKHAYIHPFQTSGDWQTVEVPFNRMTPQWRGNSLDLPNYPGQVLSHVRFLIGNGRPESFRLEIDKIWLK